MKNTATHIAFSIVIPLYNKVNSFEKTLRSVLDQAHQNWELIVVNDGSTDGSEVLFDQLTDPRIRLVVQKNQGVSVARNRGIELAKNPWVALLDADDWWDRKFLSTMAVAIEAQPDRSLFCSGRSFVYPDRVKRLENKRLPVDGREAAVDYYQILCGGLPIVHSSNLIFHSERRPVRFRAGMTQYEDHEAWFRICAGHSIYVVNNPLSFYNKTQTGGASGKKPKFDNVIKYAETIHEVWSRAEYKQKKWMKRFAVKFYGSLLLKRQYGYSPQQREQLYQTFRPILGTSVRALGSLQNKLLS